MCVCVRSNAHVQRIHAAMGDVTAEDGARLELAMSLQMSESYFVM